MKVLVVQSVDTWIDILKNLVNTKYKEIADCFSFTDSFDNAVELVESKMKNEELYVITSEMFHDQYSSHRETATYHIAESLKCASTLGELIKGINPKAKVFVFSEFKPVATAFIDEFVRKSGTNTSGVERVIDNIAYQS